LNNLYLFFTQRGNFRPSRWMKKFWPWVSWG